MSDPTGDLEARVTALERDRTHLYEEIGAALVLARGADKDTREFRTALAGHHKVLEALRATQLEQDTKLADLRSDVTDLSRRTREGFDMLAQGQVRITDLLERLAGPDGGSATT